MKRHALVLGAVVVFLGAFLNRAAAEEKEKVVLAHWGKEKILLYLPLYIAIEEGLFAKRGLELSLKYSGNDDQVFATVMSGEADLGVGDPVFAAIARQRGFPGKVVAGLVVRIGLSGYTDRRDIPEIDKAEQLAGLRIASFPAPSTTYTLLSELLRNNQPALSRTRIVQTAIGAQAAALGAGSVDIATDLEPAVSLAESKGSRVVFSLDRFTPALAITGLSTTEDVIARKPETIAKVVSAIDEALRLLSNSSESGVRSAEKSFPQLPKPVVQRAVKRLIELSVFPQTARISEENWERTLKLRITSGDLTQIQKTKGALENRFTEAARRM